MLRYLQQQNPVENLFGRVETQFGQVEDVWLRENKSKDEIVELIEKLMILRGQIEARIRNLIANYVVTLNDIETFGNTSKLAFLACMVDGPMVIYKNYKIGYGVFAEKLYEKGGWITDYGGVVIPRGKEISGDYVMKLKQHEIDGKYNFKISQKGRWINEPNLAPINYESKEKFESACEHEENCLFHVPERFNGFFTVTFRLQMEEGLKEKPHDIGTEILVRYGQGRDNNYQRPWRENMTIEVVEKISLDDWIIDIRQLETRQDTLAFKLYMQRLLSRRQKWTDAEKNAPTKIDATVELLQNIVEYKIGIPLTDVGKANVKMAVNDDIEMIHANLKSLAQHFQLYEYLILLRESLDNWERDYHDETSSPEESRIVEYIREPRCMQHVKSFTDHLLTTTSLITNPDKLMAEFFLKIFESYFFTPFTKDVEEDILYKLETEFDINVSRIWGALRDYTDESLFSQLFFPEIVDKSVKNNIVSTADDFCSFFYKTYLLEPLLLAENKYTAVKVDETTTLSLGMYKPNVHIYTLATFFEKDSINRKINNLFKFYIKPPESEKKKAAFRVKSYLLFQLATRTFDWAQNIGYDISTGLGWDEDEYVIDVDDLIRLDSVEKWARENASIASSDGNSLLSGLYEDLGHQYGSLIDAWEAKIPPGEETHDGTKREIEKLSFNEVVTVFGQLYAGLSKKEWFDSPSVTSVKEFKAQFKQAKGPAFEAKQKKKRKELKSNKR